MVSHTSGMDSTPRKSGNETLPLQGWFESVVITRPGLACLGQFLNKSALQVTMAKTHITKLDVSEDYAWMMGR